MSATRATIPWALAIALAAAAFQPGAAGAAGKKVLPKGFKPPVQQQDASAGTSAGGAVQMQADPAPAGAVGASGSLQPEPQAGEAASPGSGVSTQAAPAASAGVEASAVVPAAVSGQIYDPRGRPLVGVEVTAVNGADRRQTRTDEQGNYLLWLPPGEWEVSARSLDYEFTPTTKVFRVADGRADRIR